MSGKRKNVRFSPKQRTTLQYDDTQSLGSLSDSELSVTLERQPNKSILLNKTKLVPPEDLQSDQSPCSNTQGDSANRVADTASGNNSLAGVHDLSTDPKEGGSERKLEDNQGPEAKSSPPLSLSKTAHPNKYCELGLTKNKDCIPVTSRTHNVIYSTPPGSLKRSGYSVTYINSQAETSGLKPTKFNTFLYQNNNNSQEISEQSAINGEQLKERVLDTESTSGFSSEVFDDRLQDFEETQDISEHHYAPPQDYRTGNYSTVQEHSSFDLLNRPVTMNGCDYVAANPTLNRLQEKQELRELNDRLSTYLQRVKLLSEQTNHVDSTAFLQSTQILEDEIRNLKNLYEMELVSVRQQLDDVSREKTHYHMHMQKNEGLASSLQDRLAIEGNKNTKLMDEINRLQRTIKEKEQELADLRILSHRPYDDLNQITRDNDHLVRENADLKRRYEKELVMRQEAEDKAHSLSKKIEFDCEVYNKQSYDLQQRLEASASTILQLEAKVRELSRPDTSLQDMLTHVRESAELELRRYQQEAEHNYKQNMTSLTAQMREDSVSLENLSAENTRLSGLLEEANAKIRNLQGQLIHMEHQKKSVQENSELERARHIEHSRNLERKLHDLQDVLFVKMRDLNIARDAHIPLKAEIESLRTMLEEEERKLRFPAVSTPTIHFSPAVHGNVPTKVVSVPSTTPPLRPPIPEVSPILKSVTRAPEKILTEVPPPVLDAPVLSRPTCSPLPSTPPPGASQYELLPPTGAPVPHSAPLGPVRAKSAPANSQRDANFVSASLGQGKDYFDQMFKDLERTTYQRPHSADKGERPSSSVSHDYENSTSSATGDIRILEVNKDGRYVRLVNNSTSKDADFGGFLVQQNVGGHPVAVYRFPPRTQFKANSTITVWSGANDPIMHQPPTDFVWKEQEKWGTGPECTTILCKPNGQAIAWTTAAHRFTPNAFEEAPASADSPDLLENFESSKWEQTASGELQLTQTTVDVNATKCKPVLLKREKATPPGLTAQKHPHGQYTGVSTHPDTFQSRAKFMGNDNSSHVRQSRSQTARPDPVKGQPYCGASAQRMGSAPLRKYTTSTVNVRGSGAVANKSNMCGEPGVTSPAPSSFMKPSTKFAAGLDQLKSQHHEDFNPPMPRPPLVSQW